MRTQKPMVDLTKSNTENAIEIREVWEKYRLYHDKTNSLKETLVRFKRASYEEFWALKGVTFDIKRGDVFGVIGVNGSGKSTLLKCIARTIVPTKGSVKVNGRVSALLEVGAGFHPDLTGRENVFINGAMLGMSRREVKKKFDDIVSFAGLEQFIDMPVRSYSSGMYMRLGFSVAIHVDPEILLIDEVLSVGDQEFQMKCKEKIDELKNQGKTILLVSHSLPEVKRLCDNAAWLEAGTLRDIGPVDKVVSAYMEDVHNKRLYNLEEQAKATTKTENRWGSREVEITKFEILDSTGQERFVVRTGEDVRVRIAYEAHQRVDKPVFGFVVFRPDGLVCIVSTTRTTGNDVDFVEEGEGVFECVIDDLNLLAGSYVITAYIYDDSLLLPYDHHDKMYELMIIEGKYDEKWGVYHIPSTWSQVESGKHS